MPALLVRSTHDLSGSQSVITRSVAPASRPLPGEAEPVYTACAQQATGSPLLANLNAGREVETGVDHTNVVTRYDEVVLPYRSGYLPGPSTQITNITLQARCPLNFTDHLLIIYDYAVLQWSSTIAPRWPGQPNLSAILPMRRRHRLAAHPPSRRRP